MIPHEKLTMHDLEIVRVPAKTSESKKIIMLHGYGANCYDLLPLASVIDPEKNWDWYFPNAPLQVEIGPGYYGRAWFPIDMMQLQMALMSGKTKYFENANPEGFEDSSKKVRQLVKSFSSSGVVVGGFSQGAMLSIDAALHGSVPILGVLIFSGTLIRQTEWEKKLPTMNGIPFFQSHGKADPVLPFTQAVALNKLLLKHDWTGNFVPFQGGHEIPMDVCQGASDFLSSLSL